MKIVFIGYAQSNKTYLLFDDGLGVIIESRDVEFFEVKFLWDVEISNPISTSGENFRLSQVIEEPRKSTRARKDKNTGDDFYSYLGEGSKKSSEKGHIWVKVVKKK